VRLKALTSVATVAFVACLPFLLLTSSIWWAANSHWLYTSGFQRYDVARSTGFSDIELGRIAEGMIDYFNSGEELVGLTIEKNGQTTGLFTEEEAIHFRDVKGLFRLDLYVLLGTGAYAALFAAICAWRRAWRRLARGVLFGSVATLAVLLLLGVGVLIDFDWLFLQFHFLAFTNEFWSTPGYMLLLFPGGFWYDAVVRCALASAGIALVLGTAAGTYLRRSRHNEEV
jgi:integral membrane protein (TIGR01906 family)